MIECEECDGVGEFDCLEDCSGDCPECNGHPVICRVCNGKGYNND